MASERRLRLVNALLVLALLGAAQWFFGNLYDAVVTAPNWRVGFEYEAITGRSQHGDGAIQYYVPTTGIAIVLLWVAALLGRRTIPDVRWNALRAIQSSPSRAVAGSPAVNQSGAWNGFPARETNRAPSQ